jgi:hypothetical protein
MRLSGPCLIAVVFALPASAQEAAPAPPAPSAAPQAADAQPPAAVPPSATAPQQPPAAMGAPLQRVKGTIATFDPATETLSVTTPDHRTVSVALQQATRLVYDQRRKLADIKAGDFVGVGALKGADGKLRAQQVVVFPDSMRGVGEGQYPMGDPASNRLMTNASVVNVAGYTSASGSLELSYKGSTANPDGTCSGRASAAGSAGCTGTASISVAKGVPVIAIVPGDQSLLVPGASVSVLMHAAPDGSLTCPALTVEKDGVKPLL